MELAGQTKETSWDVTFLPPVNIQAGIEEALVRERIRSENFRLNYETLKSLHIRLRNQIISAQPEILDLGLYKKKELPAEKQAEDIRALPAPSKSVQTLPLEQQQEKSIREIRELKLALEAQPGNNDLKALYSSILDQYKNYKDNTYNVMKKLTEEYDQMLEVIRDKFQSQLDQSTIQLSEVSSENRKLTREGSRMKGEVDILKAEIERLANELAQSSPEKPKKSKLEESIKIQAHNEKCQLELRMSRQREEALAKELAAREAQLEDAIEKLAVERNDHIVEVRSLQAELDRSELAQTQMKSNLNSKITEINATLQEQVKHTAKLTKFVDEREYGYAEAKEELSQFVTEIMKNSNVLVHCLQKSVEASRKDSEHMSEHMADLQRKAQECRDLSKKYAFLIKSASEEVLQVIPSFTSFVTIRDGKAENELNKAIREDNFDFIFEDSEKKIYVMLKNLTHYKKEATETINRSHKRASALESELSDQRSIRQELVRELRKKAEVVRKNAEKIKNYRHRISRLNSVVGNLFANNNVENNNLQVVSTPSLSPSDGAMDSSLPSDLLVSSESPLPEPNSPVPPSPAVISQDQVPRDRDLRAPPSTEIPEPSTQRIFVSSSRQTYPATSTMTTQLSSFNNPLVNREERNELNGNSGFGNPNTMVRATQHYNMEVDGSGDTGRPRGELIRHLRFAEILYGSDTDVNHQ